MDILNLNILLYLVLLVTHIRANVVSEEQGLHNDQETSRKNADFDESERRFFDNFNDKDWHIMHLKEADFTSRRSDCEETFEDKVRRYRASLRNDAARLEYVSADILPVNKKEFPTGTCKAKVVDASKVSKETNNSIKSVKGTTPKETRPVNTTNDIKSERINVATTDKSTIKEDVKQNKSNEGRRSNEYIFSDAEYDEEGEDWDLSACYDTVDIIDLDQDDIRPYDVECQFILDWRSLD